ncbi:MAG: hypothetical protein GQE15_27335 [Archangiaceae bacterium]|nr:hypothetical protein [Archangiaceae bacterium]
MTLPKMMKAAQVQQRGAAKFEVVELPVPQPGPGQVEPPRRGNHLHH